MHQNGTRARASGGGVGSSIRGSKPGTKHSNKNPLPVEKVVEDAHADDEEVCFICAEPVKYYALSECNHRTCHICSLRLRALYNNMNCTYCKEPQSTLIFTISPDDPFSAYTPNRIPFKDMKLSIFFETLEMMEETLILLRFNCPDSSCDYIGNGWGDLKLHTRAAHGKLTCELCIKHKKVFAHEHALYPPNVLPFHLPSIYNHSNKSPPSSQIEGGIHPICEFCRKCFFGSDELYIHCRENHEECFICKLNGVRDQYFLNYESLERHFENAHYPCKQAACQARKFVVFNTRLDLQAHTVEDHGDDMSSKDKREARRIQAEFAFEEVNHEGRGGRRDHGKLHQAQNQHRPPHEQHQRQQQFAPRFGDATPSAPSGSGNRRREAFGAGLTNGNPGPNSSKIDLGVQQQDQNRPASPVRADLDPAIAERHAMFMARLQSLSPNSTNAVSAVQAATRSYRTAQSSARDLISTIWHVLDRNLEHTASIINAFVDLLDEEEKKQDLLASWKGFALEQRRQFPDLIPQAIGKGYENITSGRVLNAKHSTATRSSKKSSKQVWDRVARVASASSSYQTSPWPVNVFPSLNPSPAAGPSATRKGPHNTPWSASGSTGFIAPVQTTFAGHTHTPTSQPASGSNTPRRPPLSLSNALFPELPSVAKTISKPQVSGNKSLRNIMSVSANPTVDAWQNRLNEGRDSTIEKNGLVADSEDGDKQLTRKKRKGKQKQKQTLFTYGALPG